MLADRSEHILERPPAADLNQDDNPWGFRIPVPEALYNRGELYNLCIRRGTLSEEDRYKIKEHVVQTICMLDALPFPRHLEQVPEIAGGHHETMDGQGYPRRLQGKDMSPLARMLAVADIFEALTASDRPYKSGKTLSQALKIMQSMVRDQHIDGEIFDLFLAESIPLVYARQHLKPEQIDLEDFSDFRVQMA